MLERRKYAGEGEKYAALVALPSVHRENRSSTTALEATVNVVVRKQSSCLLSIPQHSEGEDNSNVSRIVTERAA